MEHVLNIGSLNIDHVYQVDAIVAGGQTIASGAYATYAGGKGANQSTAIARAGGHVRHVGCVGRDGRWLTDRLEADGVDVAAVRTVDHPTGHAMIQVDAQGENAIVIHAGANHAIAASHLRDALASCGDDDLVLLQNETNDPAAAIDAAISRGLRVCLNPAPCTPDARDLPLSRLYMLIVNESEACELAQVADADAAFAQLAQSLPRTQLIMTRGGRGVLCHVDGSRIERPAMRVDAIDTTAAGDTFIGYLLASITRGRGWNAALAHATQAAALCVTRAGAIDSIPHAAELTT